MAPIDTLIAWFNELSTEMKEEAAFLIFFAVPYELASDLVMDEAPASKFVERVQRWSQGMPSQHVGAVLMVAGAIDLLLLNRGSEESWTEVRSIMEDVKHTGPTPSLRSFAQNSLERLPERTAMWMEATARWRQLRENELSLSSLHSWRTQQSLAHAHARG